MPPACPDLATMGSGSAADLPSNNDTWSDPIYFYANGTTSDAKVLLASDAKSAVTLVLRGITADVTIEDANTPTSTP